MPPDTVPPGSDEATAYADAVTVLTAEAASSAMPPGEGASAAAPFYVRRATDDQLYNYLQKPGTITTVRGARQTGKTSLLARVAQEV